MSQYLYCTHQIQRIYAIMNVKKNNLTKIIVAFSFFMVYNEKRVMTMPERICDKNVLIGFAKALADRGFKPGFDSMTADALVIWLEINGDGLVRDLLSGRYKPLPAVGTNIAKKHGGYRRIVRLTALDTVIQQALLDAVHDEAERQFSPRSHAYRKGRGVSTAVAQYCAEGMAHSFAAKLDPTACFDNIDHSVLRAAVADFFGDEALTRLIMRLTEMPVIIDGEPGKIQETHKGILQGAPLSSLLCNIYFHSFDTFLEEQKIPFVRYADDTVLFADSLEEIRLFMREAECFQSEKCKLKKNPAKCAVGSPSELTFLGYRFERGKNGNYTALEEDAPDHAYYRGWHISTPERENRAVDLLSDGILRQKEYSLVFENNEKEHEIPVMSTDSINIYSSVIFDTGFFKRAADCGITVNLFGQTGKLLGQFTPFSSLLSPRVTLEQFEAYFNVQKRVALAREFVLASIHNLRLVIRYYNKMYPDALYDSMLRKIERVEKKIKETDDYDELLLLEAQARQFYYQCYDSFIRAEGFVFEKRSRRPPRNEVNAMISFGNAMLYNLLATEINKTPLDVRVGFFHATNRRQQSLNLDVAEIFRPLIVDRVVFSLINRRAVTPDDFFSDGGGVYLNAEGKRIFISAFYEKLDTCVTVKGKSVKYKSIIREEVQKLVRYFRQGEKYKPFKQIR